MVPEAPVIVPRHDPSGWMVWGHPHAVAELQAAIRRGVSHAYLLSGYHGVGKRTLAMEFARALVCLDPPAPGIPCRACSACRRVSRGIHPDVTVYDLESQQETTEKTSTSKNLSVTIQTVRSISTSVALRPLEAQHRVIIVDDVETMQETAQEAFLKTLEEPPPYAVILLLTTDAELLLETIRSRCTMIQLQTVLPSRIVEALVAAGVPHQEARRIAAASVGRPGWAFEAANTPEVLAEQLALQASVLQWIRSDQYDRMAEAMRLGDAFARDRASVFARLAAAETVWRAFMLASLGLDAPELNAMPGAAKALSPQTALAGLRSVGRGIADLDANVRPRLALQSMVLQWPTFPA